MRWEARRGPKEERAHAKGRGILRGVPAPPFCRSFMGLFSNNRLGPSPRSRRMGRDRSHSPASMVGCVLRGVKTRIDTHA
jgi:hypothetical protein